MVIVACLMAIATMPGQTVLVSLYKDAIGESLGLGLTTVALSYMVGTILAGLPLPFVGRFADRAGLRRTVTLVALGFASVLIGTRYVGGFVTLTMAFFAIRFLGQGSLGMLSGHTIAMWYERKLGTVHACLAVGGFALGSTVLQKPTAWLVRTYGWQDTLFVLACMVLLLTIPSVLFVFRNKPEDIGQHLDGDPIEHETHDVVHAGAPPMGDPAFTVSETIRTGAFWILLPLMCLTGFTGTALLFHMSALMQQAGLAGTESQVATANMAWPVAFGACTLVAGPLADRLPPKWLAFVGALTMGAGTVLCLGATVPITEAHLVVPMFALGMSVYGASQAIIVAVGTPTIARYYGRTHHGAIRGVVSTAMVMSTGAGPFLVAAVADLSGDDFTVSLGVCAALVVPAMGATLLLRPPRRPDRTDHSVQF